MNYARFLNYAHWAHGRTLEMLRACPQVESKALSLFAHLLAEEHLWLCRLQGRDPDMAMWPEIGLDECEKLIAINFSGYSAFFKGCSEETLDSFIEYKTSKGVAYRTPISDVLVHVLNHGSYHRGQIANGVKRSGGEVIDTDYIAFVREIH